MLGGKSGAPSGLLFPVWLADFRLREFVSSGSVRSVPRESWARESPSRSRACHEV